MPDHPDGAIAQLGERLHGMQEVSGSIPLSSTKTLSFPYSRVRHAASGSTASWLVMSVAAHPGLTSATYAAEWTTW